MKVVVTGSVAFDHIMSMPARFKDYLQPDKLHIINVSFLMDKFRREKGGTGANQAYNLALLGYKPVLVATVGKDFLGEYKKHLQKSGVDVNNVKVFKKEFTATGFVMTDKDDNQIWGFYSGVMKKSKKVNLQQIMQKNDFLLLTPDDSEATEKRIKQADKMNWRYLFDPAFQTARLSVKSLKNGVLGAEIVIGNDYEIAMLLKRTKLSKKEILRKDRILITTLGAKGSVIETRDKKIKIPAAKPKNTSDPTGAGDAYRAGFVAGYLKGMDLKICGRMGALAAVYTVELYGTQTHKFTIDEFKRRYKENFKKNLEI